MEMRSCKHKLKQQDALTNFDHWIHHTLRLPQRSLQKATCYIAGLNLVRIHPFKDIWVDVTKVFEGHGWSKDILELGCVRWIDVAVEEDEWAAPRSLLADAVSGRNKRRVADLQVTMMRMLLMYLMLFYEIVRRRRLR
jgi:hypothetical protein